MKASPPFLLAAMMALMFTLASALVPHAPRWSKNTRSDNVLGMMFGDARKLFANQFFTMADVYFHSGYYPSIFDQNAAKEKEMISESRGKKESKAEEAQEDFLGRPRDWIDAFGRNFKITRHTHLQNGNEREILPWLRLAADLDPQNVTTFTVGAFYLREHLGRTAEAEKFLHEGIRQNPDDCELLFELGRLYHEGWHDSARARKVWELGVKKYSAQSDGQKMENRLLYEEIVVNLGHIEKEAGNYASAIKWLREAQAVSPAPEALQRQIDEVQKQMLFLPKP